MRRLSSYTKQVILATTWLGLMAGMIGQTEASQLFQIDDSSGVAISVTENGAPVTLLSDSTSDYIHFTYQIENGDVNPFGPFSFSASVDLLDPDGVTLSDRLVLTFTLNSNFVDVQFDSRLPVTLPASQITGPSVVEDGTGTFQHIYSFSNLDTNTGISSAATFLVLSEPHAAAVPEPSTLSLMVMGFAALGGTQIRRRFGQRLDLTA